MQPPLPVERLAHDLIQIVVLRFPSELGANPIIGGTIAAGSPGRRPELRTGKPTPDTCFTTSMTSSTEIAAGIIDIAGEIAAAGAG
jgi:hypothetical protein